MTLTVKALVKAIRQVKKAGYLGGMLVVPDSTIKEWKKLPTTKLAREYIMKIDSQLELLRMLLYTDEGKIYVGINGDADITKYLSPKLKKEIRKIIEI